MKSLKLRYPDWDEPDEKNEELCRKFSYWTYRGENLRFPYRLFVPEKSEGKIPLVLYLHGADVVGEDNESHLVMHDIGTVFARDDWQKRHPCVILAPQYRRGMHWARSDVLEALGSLVRETMENHPEIDPERIFVYGYSAGGVGTLELLKKFPDVFAGAMVICGATYHDHFDDLAKTPLWLLHAADDRIVSPNRSPGFGVEYYGSAALYKAMKETMGDRIHYTEYPAGELEEKHGLNPHCSWVLAGQDEAVKHWLFAQRKRK